MAISVSFGSNNVYTITLDWTQVSQSITGNTSSVKFTCTIKSNGTASFRGYGRTDTLTVGGKTFKPAHGEFTVPAGGSVKLWDYTATIAHDVDGSFKSKAISCGVLIDTTFSSSGYVGTVTATGTINLDTIARASSISVSALTLEQYNNATITTADGSFRHDIYLKVGDVSKCIKYDTVGGAVKLWPEIEQFAPAITSSASAKGTLTIYTFSAGRASIGSKEYEVTVKVPDLAKPDVSLGWASADYYNSGTPAASIAAFVQGYSKAQIVFDADRISLKYGARLKQYKISCDGVTQNGTGPYLRTGVLSGTSAKIVCTVEDSRGYTASETVTVGVLPYTRPTLTGISLYRASSDGSAASDGTRIYAKATLKYSDLNGLNACRLNAYYRAQSGSYGDAIQLESDVGAIIMDSAAINQTYVAKIVAEDNLGNAASYEATIPTDSVAFHIRDGGNGAAFFKYAEKDGVLEVNGALELVEALEIASGGTGVNSLPDLNQLVFGHGLGAGVRAYPTKPGIYRSIGTDIFSNMTQTHSTYGVLVIMQATYAMHLYVDSSNTVFVGRSGDTFAEPTSWDCLTDRTSMKKLWTNSNPANEFAGQTVSLDLSEYDLYEVIYAPTTSYTTREMSVTARVGKGCMMVGVWADTGKVFHRSATGSSSTGITFGAAYADKASNNTYCIPLAVYGIRGVK